MKRNEPAHTMNPWARLGAYTAVTVAGGLFGLAVDLTVYGQHQWIGYGTLASLAVIVPSAYLISRR